MENIIEKIVNYINISDFLDIDNKVSNTLIGLDNIYSYIVYAKYDKENTLIGWTLQYNISQIDRYNTLKADDVKNSIVKIITEFRNKGEIKYVIGYGQPAMDLMLELFEPLIIKLAKVQHERYEFLDMEDLCQDCRLVFMTLYSKGYYIHKRLLERSFINKIIGQLRKERGTTIISLDTRINGDSEENSLYLRDTLPDTQAMNELEDNELRERRKMAFKEIKKYIVGKYGQRVFEQLLRCYETNQTTDWARVLVHRIKNDLMKSGKLRDLEDKYLL